MKKWGINIKPGSGLFGHRDEPVGQNLTVGNTEIVGTSADPLIIGSASVFEKAPSQERALSQGAQMDTIWSNPLVWIAGGYGLYSYFSQP